MLKKSRQISLWLLAGLLSLGQLQRIELTGSYTGINFYLHDIFIILWLISLSFTDFTSLFKQKKTTVKTMKRYKLEITFAIIILISSIFNYFIKLDLVAFLYILRLTSYIIFSLSIKFLLKNKKLNYDLTRFQFFTVGILILFLGLLQFSFIKDTRFLSLLGWDDHFNRLISTQFDPGFTGIIFVISIVFGISLKLFKNKKLIKTIIVAAFSWGTVLTFSRASYIALLTLFSGLLIARRFKKNQSIMQTFFELGTIVIIVSGLVLIAPKPGGEGVDLTRTASITARIDSASTQLKTLGAKTAIIGNGLFSKQNSISNLEPEYGIKSHSRIPDNIFITVLLSTGVIGLIVFVLLISKWTKLLMVEDLYIGIAFLSILVHSQFNNSLLQPFVLLLFLGGVSTIKPRV